MAHDGTGTGWDILSPTDAEPRKDGAKEIRDLRIGMGIRLNKEHVTLASSSAGGEHKEGSSVIYTEPTVTFPTNKPDGATALDSNDEGRQAMVAGWMFIYSGTGWGTNSSGSFTLSTSFSAWIDVGYAFRAIIVSNSAGRNGLVIFNGTGNETSQKLTTIHTDDKHRQMEFQTEQDSGNPTDAYRFRVKDIGTTADATTYDYLVLRG